MLVRFEDLLASPAAVLRDIGRLIDEPINTVNTTTEDSSHVVLASNHSIAGNPARFISGDTPLYTHPSLSRLPRRSLWMINAVTAVLRRRYSY